MNTTRTPLPPLPEREEIALLEPFEGLGLNDIVLVATRDDAERAAAALLAAGVVGFDTESKPTFAKNEVSTGPHLVQFATRETAFPKGKPAGIAMLGMSLRGGGGRLCRVRRKGERGVTADMRRL